MNGYIHLPFCRSKCGYCAFYSEVGAERGAFMKKLLSQLAALPRDGEFETFYCGGGTPTLLDCGELRELGRAIKSLPFAPGAEISIEANPETLTPQKIEVISQFCNRISLGVQSFDPKLRAYLGRDCSQEALERAFELVDGRFESVNCDLIYAVAGQTMADFMRDLERALEKGVSHISCYNLTIEENARLGLTGASDDLAAEMWIECGERLAAAGLPRYEISNYAAPGRECRHNLNVWRGGLLRGFGPSAAGFDGRVRSIEAASLERWLAGEPPELDDIPPERRRNEIFAINLRTVAGWTPEMWSQPACADSWRRRLEQVRGLNRPEWFEISPERINLSRLGMLFWNDVAEMLL